MNNEIILFFLCICIAVLICIVVYQQFVFRRGIQKQLKEISQKLEKIQDTDSDENIMMFTDEQLSWNYWYRSTVCWKIKEK